MRNKKLKLNPVRQAKRNDQMQGLVERCQDMFRMRQEGLISVETYDTFREAVKVSYTVITGKPY